MVMPKSVTIGEVSPDDGFIEWSINVNPWNVLRIERPRVTIERHSWEPGQDRFVASWTGRFQHTAAGWAEMA